MLKAYFLVVVSLLRGKEWVTHALELEWTYIGIPKGQILDYFRLFYEFQFCFYPYICELTVFEEPIDVQMQNCCEIDMFLC